MRDAIGISTQPTTIGELGVDNASPRRTFREVDSGDNKSYIREVVDGERGGEGLLVDADGRWQRHDGLKQASTEHSSGGLHNRVIYIGFFHVNISFPHTFGMS